MQRLWLSACLLCVASAGLCHAALPAAGVPASVAADPLPSDPALIRGTLDNGLSYIIKKHAKPPQKVAMWIHLDTGSINETDRQRGLAHYLEHMSFNGSENFPPGKVVPFFESLGMTFGRDQNAFTSFDQTTYQLSLPDTKPETIDKGMTFFADILSRLSLVPTEIDNERAIITNEKTARKNVQQRVGEVMLEKMAPGSRFSQRLPIGTDESLAALNRDDFLDYYGKFYTASNATVIVVGDADPAVVEAAIKKNFGSAPKKPKPISETSGVKPYDKSFGVFVTDSELTRASVGVSRMLPMRPPTTTVEQLRQDFVETIAQQAFNRRMSDKVSRGGMPFEGAGGGISQQGRMLRLAAVNANGKPEQWREMLTTLVTEVQKARAFGFTDREVKDARREIMSSIERAARVEDTLPAQAILGRINSDLASGDTIMSSEQTLTQARAMFDGITTEEVSKYFGDAFDPTNVMYSVQLNTSGPTDAEVLKVGEDASKLAPSRDVEVARAETLMQTLPTPGTVTEQTEDKESGIWSGWLSNNTRVNYRFIDERKDTVAVTISLIGGELFETPANRGISNAASVAWGEPATKSLTGVDVRSLMNGRKVRVSGRAGADAMQLRIT
ncbi:MAG: insulinase family protein, partial [Phycisphaerales bacterium]